MFVRLLLVVHSILPVLVRLLLMVHSTIPALVQLLLMVHHIIPVLVRLLLLVHHITPVLVRLLLMVQSIVPVFVRCFLWYTVTYQCFSGCFWRYIYSSDACAVNSDDKQRRSKALLPMVHCVQLVECFEVNFTCEDSLLRVVWSVIAHTLLHWIAAIILGLKAAIWITVTRSSSRILPKLVVWNRIIWAETMCT